MPDAILARRTTETDNSVMQTMIPAGYLYKKVGLRPAWIEAPGVRDIYSLSRCVSDDFDDYIQYWKHNGYWLFDTPAIMQTIAKEINLSLADMKLFYYEFYDKEYYEEEGTWSPYEREQFPTSVEIPLELHLEGFDAVTFSLHTSPECSPLSCCNLAKEIPVNSHCLFDTFEQAKQALEAGKFNHSEPGPFRIIAVHSVGRAA